MITELRRSHRKMKGKIDQALFEYSQIKPKDYFYELCFCVLTPQSNAFTCNEAVILLKKNNFATKDVDVLSILKSRTRFHITKSKRLLDLKEQYPSLYPVITNGMASREKRDFLVKNVKGIGYKEASHFLRNVGHNNLGILDRHILKHLRRLKVINEIPKSMNSKKYLEIEKKFHDFSKKIKIPMDELDLTFWSMETGVVFK